MHACIHTYKHTYLPTYLRTYIHTYICTYMFIISFCCRCFNQRFPSPRYLAGRGTHWLTGLWQHQLYRWVNAKEHQTCAAMDLRFRHTHTHIHTQSSLFWGCCIYIYIYHQLRFFCWLLSTLFWLLKYQMPCFSSSFAPVVWPRYSLYPRTPSPKRADAKRPLGCVAHCSRRN